MEMDSAVFTTLEYNKIIDMLMLRTGSAMGRELAETLLPIYDYDEVTEKLAETYEARNVLMTAVPLPFGGFRDIRAALKHAEIGATIDIKDLLAVGSTLYAARQTKAFFAETNNTMPILSKIADLVTPIRPLEIEIENTLTDQGQVRDDASSELLRLRREIRTFQARVKERIEHILHSPEYQKHFQDVLVTMRGDRYVVPIKQEYRNRFPGIVHDQSGSGATVFMEPLAVIQLNNDIKQAIAAERNEIERILLKLSTHVAQASELLRITCESLAKLDFIFAKAKLSIDMQAEKPLINTQGKVKLIAARHPLIDQKSVVPIDVYLGEKFNILLITGPNTGGKTVSLKTVGLFALMIQSGLFIPAKSTSEISLFKNIYADIGDEQSIECSLSTFSAHMTNLVRILAKANEGDLVLIDEIGSGTDPSEGAALAMSIIEHLQANKICAMATTHYSELKTFAFSRQGIENASVEFDEKTLRPTYRLLIGVPGSSNAFNISLRLGLDKKIVKRAGELLDTEHVKLDTILSELDAKKREFEEHSKMVELLRNELSAQNIKLSAEQATWNEKKRNIIDKAQEEAADLIRQARREAEVVISDLKELFSVKDQHKRQQTIDVGRKRLNDTMARLQSTNKSDNAEIPTIDQLLPGMSVYVVSLRQQGIIQSIKGDMVQVQLGILKVNVGYSDCRLVSAENKATTPMLSRQKTNINKAQTFSTEIDIRGMMVADAEEVLEKYIDDAVLSNIVKVRIIHGKGTGALRKGIQVFLRNHPAVKRISIAESNEGGDGATNVEFI